MFKKKKKGKKKALVSQMLKLPIPVRIAVKLAPGVSHCVYLDEREIPGQRVSTAHWSPPAERLVCLPTDSSAGWFKTCCWAI